MSDQTPPADLEQIADLALGEIQRRFSDQPKDIPDHVLAKYFTDVNKVIDRRSEKEAEDESRPFSLMDELDTLPVERARALVKEEIERLQAELAHYEEWYARQEVPQHQEPEGVRGAEEEG